MGSSLSTEGIAPKLLTKPLSPFSRTKALECWTPGFPKQLLYRQSLTPDWMISEKIDYLHHHLSHSHSCPIKRAAREQVLFPGMSTHGVSSRGSWSVSSVLLFILALQITPVEPMRFHGIHHEPCCRTGDEHESICLTKQCFPASVILLSAMLKSPVPEQILSFDTKDLMFSSVGSGQGRELGNTSGGQHQLPSRGMESLCPGTPGFLL